MSLPGQALGQNGLMMHENFIIQANNPAMNMHPSMLANLPQDIQNDLLQKTQY